MIGDGWKLLKDMEVSQGRQGRQYINRKNRDGYKAVQSKAEQSIHPRSSCHSVRQSEFC